MKVISYILAGIFSFCVLIIIAITSVEILVYYVPNYYAHEYNKYDVPRSLSMEVEDLVSVTKEMTAYLKGNRENLSDITATINGQENVNFFNSKEVAHMMDVKALFRAAITIRLVLLVLSAVLLIIMALLKQHPSRIISLMMMICSGVFMLTTTVLAFIISSDFDRYFIKFPHFLPKENVGISLITKINFSKPNILISQCLAQILNQVLNILNTTG